MSGPTVETGVDFLELFYILNSGIWNNAMQLKPQDIVVLLKLVALAGRSWTYATLALSLGMSPSQAYHAVHRARAVQLAVDMNNSIVPHLRNLEEFLVHGLRYVFPAVYGELTRGMPTSYAAPPLSRMLRMDDEPPPVWPDPEGTTRGMAFSPLFRSVPEAARADATLYELLALVDAIRGGRARERNLAVRELNARLGGHDASA